LDTHKQDADILSHPRWTTTIIVEVAVEKSYEPIMLANTNRLLEELECLAKFLRPVSDQGSESRDGDSEA